MTPATNARRISKHTVVVVAAVMVLAAIMVPAAAWYWRESSKLVPSDASLYVDKGMTKQEVIAVLGEPHVDWGDGSWTYYRYEPLFFLRVGFGNDPLTVDFDENDRVNRISL